jgi:hypothetical protein
MDRSEHFLALGFVRRNGPRARAADWVRSARGPLTSRDPGDGRAVRRCVMSKSRPILSEWRVVASSRAVVILCLPEGMGRAGWPGPLGYPGGAAARGSGQADRRTSGNVPKICRDPAKCSLGEVRGRTNPPHRTRSQFFLPFSAIPFTLGVMGARCVGEDFGPARLSPKLGDWLRSAAEAPIHFSPGYAGRRGPEERPITVPLECGSIQECPRRPPTRSSRPAAAVGCSGAEDDAGRDCITRTHSKEAPR